MIPLRLALEGLYSYQERQVVDFTRLTDAGLFGIFGAVGSGKSSILEAISFALYGETERLNKNDKRGYNMMNLRSDRLYIEFDFLNYEQRKFRVVRESKRNKKDFQTIVPAPTVWYEWLQESWVPIKDLPVETIVGLSYDNFKRTIIIPQGQFKEFLELGVAQRTGMMKEIFQLHRFDLSEKVALLTARNKSELDLLDGELKAFEGIHEALLLQKNMELQQLEESVSQRQKAFETASEKWQQLKLLKNDFEQWQQQQTTLESLAPKQAHYEALQKRLDLQERIQRDFEMPIRHLEKQESQLAETISQLHTTTEALKKEQNILHNNEAQLEQLAPYYQQLKQKRQEEEDLEMLCKIAIARQALEELQQRTVKGEEALQVVVKQVSDLQNKIEAEQSIITQLKPQKIEPQRLLAIAAWFQKNRQLEDDFKNQQAKWKQLQQEVATIQQALSTWTIHADTVEKEWEHRLQDWQQQKETLQQQKYRLDAQAQLSEFAGRLQEGAPCPLCGSEHHPSVLTVQDTTADRAAWDMQWKALEIAEKDGQKDYLEAQRWVERKRIAEQQMREQQQLSTDIQNATNTHRAQFSWNEFDAARPDEFYQAQKKSLEIEQQLDAAAVRVEQLRQEKDTAEKTREKYQNALESFRLKEQAERSLMQSLQSNMKVLKADEYTSSTPETLQAQRQKLKQENDRVESTHESLSASNHILSNQITAIQTKADILQTQRQQLEASVRTLQSELEELISKTRMGHLEQVKEFLRWEFDIDGTRKEIAQFHIQWETIKKTIATLQKKLETAAFSEEQYQQQELLITDLEQQLNAVNEQYAVAKAEVSRLSAAWTQKQQLTAKRVTLAVREKNLKTMFSLFKASGFVQYVSSVYLRQLCSIANHRFQRMTRNQLSLQMNDSNDFEIIDYLNEGRSRSLKTLSGGQMFQASLSLALALAENVQSMTVSDKTFFFIDEGFGTQDAESVNIIFETLLHLNKENKIVGIISHVEELKERIPQSLTIINDSEKGSLIKMD